MRSSFRARRYTLPLTRGPLSLEGNKTEQNACQLCILQDLCITEKYLFQWLGEGLWGDIRWSWLEKDCFSHCSEWAFVWGLILSAVTRFFFFFSIPFSLKRHCGAASQRWESYLQKRTKRRLESSSADNVTIPHRLSGFLSSFHGSSLWDKFSDAHVFSWKF